MKEAEAAVKPATIANEQRTASLRRITSALALQLSSHVAGRNAASAMLCQVRPFAQLMLLLAAQHACRADLKGTSLYASNTKILLSSVSQCVHNSRLQSWALTQQSSAIMLQACNNVGWRLPRCWRGNCCSTAAFAAGSLPEPRRCVCGPWKQAV